MRKRNAIIDIYSHICYIFKGKNSVHFIQLHLNLQLIHKVFNVRMRIVNIIIFNVMSLNAFNVLNAINLLF